MRIGEQIKNYRKTVGLTQEQVANYLGVSTPAVNKWEKGNTYPDISLLPALARLLKIDMNELFSFHEELTEKEKMCIRDRCLFIIISVDSTCICSNGALGCTGISKIL